MRLQAKILALFIALSAIASWCGIASAAPTDGALRWKFKVGEVLDYTMVQEMNMVAAGGPVGQMNTTMRQEMDMTWDVQGVNEEGEAVIRQKFERIKMKMSTPVGGFDFDSKSEAAPTGLAALIAPMYKAMTQGEFEITMTARGEVKDVKVPEEVITALKASPGAAQMGDIATADGFKKMISQGALVLPENAPKEGDTWQTKVDMNNPAVGKQTVETTYKYIGTKEIDGIKYAVIKPELKMEFEKKEGDAKAPQQLSMKIAEQSSDGEVLFNVEAGRLASTKLQQKVAIDATVGGKTMQQKIDQKIEVKVTPAGDKKAEEEHATKSEEKKSEAKTTEKKAEASDAGKKK